MPVVDPRDFGTFGAQGGMVYVVIAVLVFCAFIFIGFLKTYRDCTAVYTAATDKVTEALSHMHGVQMQLDERLASHILSDDAALERIEKQLDAQGQLFDRLRDWVLHTEKLYPRLYQRGDGTDDRIPPPARDSA